MDIDDLSAAGWDSYDRLICVARLTGVYGLPLVAPNFNCLLVDSGHARLENSPTTSSILRIGGPGRLSRQRPSHGRVWGRSCRRISRKICFPGGRIRQERSWTGPAVMSLILLILEITISVVCLGQSLEISLQIIRHLCSIKFRLCQRI